MAARHQQPALGSDLASKYPELLSPRAWHYCTSQPDTQARAHADGGVCLLVSAWLLRRHGMKTPRLPLVLAVLHGPNSTPCHPLIPLAVQTPDSILSTSVLVVLVPRLCTPSHAVRRGAQLPGVGAGCDLWPTYPWLSCGPYLKGFPSFCLQRASQWKYSAFGELPDHFASLFRFHLAFLRPPRSD